MRDFTWVFLLVLCWTGLVTGVSFAQEDAASPERDSGGIVVWRLTANEDVREMDVTLISNFVTSQVSGLSQTRVISEADIQTILRGEVTRQQCGVGDTACLVEIGAALGVPEAISGDIGKIGSFWMLTLRRVNARTAEVIARSSLSIEGSIDDLIRAIPGAVAELFGKGVKPAPAGVAKPDKRPEPPPEPAKPGRLRVNSEPAGASLRVNNEERGRTPQEAEWLPGTYRLELSLNGYTRVKERVEVRSEETTDFSVTLERAYPMNPYKKYGYVSFFTGLGLAAFGGVATWQAHVKAEDFRQASTSSAATSARDANKGWGAAAITGYTLGGAAIITGIVLWVIAPDDKTWWEVVK